MKPPCLYMVNEVIPNLRKRISKKLSQEGYTQKQIAESLGITQAMVSKYLKTDLEEIDLDLKNLSEVLTTKILNDYPEEELINDLCQNCLTWRESGLTCPYHKEFNDLDQCNVCMDLRTQEKSEERSNVLESLNRVIDLVKKDKNFPNLIPEVRSNFVFGLKGAENVSEVAAIPGRITKVKNKAVTHSKAEFGASDHLASILISILELDLNIRSIMNIKYERGYEELLEEEGLKYESYERTENSEIKKDIKEIFKKSTSLDALIDTGEYGIEPAIYIFGKDPLDVYKKIKSITERSD